MEASFTLTKNLSQNFNLYYWQLFYLIPLKEINLVKNIDLCFPELSVKDREKLHKSNVIASAKIIFDSGISWFWSDKKINKLIKYEIRGLDKLLEDQKNNNGVLLFLSTHFIWS